MSVEISLCNGQAAVDASETHILPCRIELDGQSDVPMYFTPEDAEGLKKASFRGRELSGEAIPVGDKCSAYVIKSVGSDTTKWTTEHSVSGFTCWARDTDPRVQTIGMKKLLGDWPVISSVVASEISEEELAAEMKRMEEAEEAKQAATPTAS